MKLRRTASRARNGIENSVNFKESRFRIAHEIDEFCLEVLAGDVQEFGNPKTHYDYTVSVSFSDLISLIEIAANSSGEAKEYIKKEIGKDLGKIVKLVNLCAE